MADDYHARARRIQGRAKKKRRPPVLPTAAAVNLNFFATDFTDGHRLTKTGRKALSKPSSGCCL
jgi:hypothetical protein